MNRRRYLYRGRILALALQDERWEIVEHKDAVAVLALSGGRVLVVEQYRVAIGRTTLELPAGLIEPGEAPVAAARRELMEETGFDAELTELLSFYSSPGFTDERVTLFQARNLTARRRPPDPDEKLRVHWIEWPALLEAIRAGHVATSSPTVAGLLWLSGQR